MLRSLLFAFSVLCCLSLTAQLPGPGGMVHYGNEWIEYEKQYLRVTVAEDGFYRVSPEQIAAAGLNTAPGTNYALYHQGQPVRVLNEGGGIIFYGERNRGELDQYLFRDPERMQLNDRYSMYTDTAVYYLTEGSGLVYSPAEPGPASVVLSSFDRTAEVVFAEHYSKTFFRASRSSIYFSQYDVADGFGSRSSNDLLSDNGTTESGFSLDLPGAIAGAATLNLRFGLGFETHEQSVRVNGQELSLVEAAGWVVEQLALPFSSAGESVEVAMNGSRSDRDKANLAWAEVRYPARPTALALRSFIAPASAQNQLLTLQDLGADAGAMRLVDRKYGTIIPGQVDGDAVQFVLPAQDEETTYHVLTEGTTSAPATVSPKTFAPALPEGDGINYLVLTSERLRGSELEDFATYRRSPAGGNYAVQITAVEDLYDEFSYGIARHPMAIRNYVTRLSELHPGLRYLFIVGKGRELLDLRTATELEAAAGTFFVPSFGYPASDNLLTAPVHSIVPRLATGRLAVISPSEISIYLNKLREVEAQINRGSQVLEDRQWMKQILHLGGGGGITEQTTIRNNLAQLENTIETTPMGANVTSFFKSSSDPISTSQQESVFTRINNGLAMLTFYGHSSSNVFDFSIDNPANYDNKGRYPYMLSLGCYSGDAFTRSRSISERFLLLPDKAAIAFAASKGIGFIPSLRVWADHLYKLTGDDMYGQGVGDIMRENIRHFQDASSYSLLTLAQQFALSGDPAYRIHPRPGPDLVVDATSIRFEPEVIPAQDDSFTVNLRLVNIGRLLEQDSFTLSLKLQLPNEELVDLGGLRLVAPRYAHDLAIRLPSVGLRAVGQSRLLISVDTDRDIAEQPLPGAEDNNNVILNGQPGVPITFIANTARVAQPPRYAVVGDGVELIACTTDPLAPEREYIFQTSEQRDFRQLLTSRRIVSSGGIIRVPFSQPPPDSTTVYWRVSPDSSFTEGAGFIWSNSNFTYLAENDDANQWAVQHPGQLIDGTFTNILADTLTEDWNFAQDATEYRVLNATYRGSSMPTFYRDQQRLGSPFSWRVRTGMSVLVVDSLTGKWRGNPGLGEYGTLARPNDTWDFDTRTTAGRQNLLDFLDNGVEFGNYVILYSLQRGNVDYYNTGWTDDEEEFGTSVFEVLEEAGAIQIRRLNSVGSVPYAFAFRKGLGPIAEIMAESVTDTIEMRIPTFANWNHGQYESPRAGPATEWRSAQVTIGERNLSVDDSLRISLVGYSVSGSADTLRTINGSLINGREHRFDLSAYSASRYPQMSVFLSLRDDVGRSTASVKQVYFDYVGVSDVAINPTLSLSLPDSLQQGERGVVNVAYENISQVAFDSLLVRLELLDGNNELTTYTKLQAPLPPGASGEVDYEFETTQLAGKPRLRLVLNPQRAQPEDILFNNVLTKQLKIGRDEIHPLLTVLFDGRQISEGELVSARPAIRIQLRDDNAYLSLDDTSAYRVTLIAPSGQSTDVRFNNPDVEFIPASAEENKAEILFDPELSEDGIYRLIVKGRDRSGNRAGRLDFEKTFEVINEMRASNVLAYPNPFTTQTRFVYTLTGSELPTVFRIQIMTVSGRVVRDINLLDTEDLKVGTHRTNFTWDGTDEFGDQLANGVYLYRVITADSQGGPLKKFETGTDQYFKQGLGKVVILR